MLIENNFAWHKFFGLLRPQGEYIKKKRESEPRVSYQLGIYLAGRESETESERQQLREWQHASSLGGPKCSNFVHKCAFYYLALRWPSWQLPFSPSAFTPPLHTPPLAVTAAPLAVPSSGNVSAFQSCQSVFFCRLAKYLFIYTLLPQKLLLTQTNTATMGNY